MFFDRLAAAVARKGPTCVGLDPHLPLVLAQVRSDRPPAEVVRGWSLTVLEAVAPHCAAVKPQVAFYEALGSRGIAALEETVAAARALGLLVVLDAKRGDIGTTAEAYAHATLDDGGPLGADALTVSPWLGPESMAPYLARAPEKGLFVLLRTSNPGAERWQAAAAPDLASWIAEVGAGAVVGATVPDEAARWRAALPSTWFLVPGYGAQGGTLDTLRNLSPRILVNNSRAVLFGADDGADWPAAIGRRAARFADELGALDG